ncbi:MAG: molybdopterin-dependent oxidoreductase [Thermodesulfobacteriota bacterium]
MSRREDNWFWEEDGLRVVRSIARTAPGCHSGCGVLLFVDKGRLVKVEGNPAFPFNRGRLCPRCQALPEVVYHPGRLQHPLIRNGKRGENKWRPASWDEALDIIAGRLLEIRARFGPESVLFCSGTARDIAYWIGKLADSYGSPNNTCWGPLYGEACYRPKLQVLRHTVGSPVLVADCAQFFPEQFNHPAWNLPACILIWGNNPVVSSPDGFNGPWIVECVRKGAKLIVVDPRKTWIASRADHWLQIRPGTDSALALGFLNVIIQEKLYDEVFVEKWVHGFPQLKERARSYTPEKVADITWLPPEQIVRAARMYASSKPAAVQWGVAIDQSRECMSSIHAIIALMSITGNVETPGGNVIQPPIPGLPSLTKPAEQRAGNAIPSPFPLSPASGQHVIDQILTGRPYPIHASWVQGTNTFVTEADPRRVYHALQKIDFNVVVDLFMTPTALALADIVLPAVTYAEKDGLTLFPPPLPYVGALNRAIDPIGEAKSDAEINLQLGKRLNPEAWPWKDVYEWFDALLSPLGLNFETLRTSGWLYPTFEYRKHEKGLLRSDGLPGFNTGSGKIEIYSTALEGAGLDPLPYYEEPPESPVSTPLLAEQYPLVLTTGAKVHAFFHSEHRQIQSLRQMHPDPLVEIHPETAGNLGIRDGDWVYIENQFGKCKQKARLTPGIHKKVVHAQHGWWFPEKAPSTFFGAWESNIGLLIPAGWTGRSGYGYPFKSLLCRVYKAEETACPDSAC